MISPAVRKATLLGGVAILIWSSLAILTTLSGDIPAFQLVAMAFSIAFVLGLLYIKLRGSALNLLFSQPVQVWALGIWGLFGYHVLYFVAFRLAPSVEVNLLNYLWPLLIVLLSLLLLGEPLRWWHLLGTLLALLGTLILFRVGGEFGIHPKYLPGYAAAVGAALVWSTYSVISRKYRQVPTEMVAAYCGATAALAALSHLLFETTVVPRGGEWLVVTAIGLGPVGAAFYLWDQGVKRGDIMVLGAGAYIIPLFSTGLLVIFGKDKSTWEMWVSCVLIVLGAAIAGKELWDVPGRGNKNQVR